MLKTDMEEPRERVMAVPDMEPAAVAKFLEFVYTGAVVEVEEHLEELLKAEVAALVSGEYDIGFLHIISFLKVIYWKLTVPVLPPWTSVFPRTLNLCREHTTIYIVPREYTM